MRKYFLLISLLVSIFASPVLSEDQDTGLTFSFHSSNDTPADIVLQNSANFDASAATLGIRQKGGGRFALKVRIPKVRDKVVRVRVKVADEFAPHVKVKSKIFKAKRNKANIVFFMKVKRSINKLIPIGSLIDVPVTVTDLQNNVDEEFILEVRD